MQRLIVGSSSTASAVLGFNMTKHAVGPSFHSRLAGSDIVRIRLRWLSIDKTNWLARLLLVHFLQPLGFGIKVAGVAGISAQD